MRSVSGRSGSLTGSTGGGDAEPSPPLPRGSGASWRLAPPPTKARASGLSRSGGRRDGGRAEGVEVMLEDLLVEGSDLAARIAVHRSAQDRLLPDRHPELLVVLECSALNQNSI